MCEAENLQGMGRVLLAPPTLNPNPTRNGALSLRDVGFWLQLLFVALHEGSEVRLPAQPEPQAVNFKPHDPNPH